MSSQDEFDLCSLEDIKSKETLVFQFRAPGIGPHEIALFWNGEQVYALENICPHLFASLASGRIEGRTVICPSHAAVFDLDTGECLDRFAEDTEAYKVEVKDDRVWVHAPGEELIIRA